ncbi:EamA family transporter RarD [Leucobacter sp. W1478]|uniref:EamA family transporter RarD n=1 Tax=Leucobacter sp. W1478 TaxID=3439065 RepID=UPI003F3E78E7
MTNRSGYFYGVAAYLWWGAFPLFFTLLSPIDPLEIVPWRVMTAVVFCVIAVVVMRSFGALTRVFKSPKQLGWFAVSSILLYANWQIFVIAIVTGQILEASLGYFINPLMTVFIGVLVRRERLRRAQWAAVGIASTGVIIGAIAYGSFPWLALGLAVTFALYGAVRKQASEDIDPLSGLTVETLVALPVAALQLLALVLLGGSLTAFTHGPAVTIPLLLSGVATAIPLLLFGAANRRLPLSHLGFIQFLTPILGFLSGYFIFHEEMPLARWIGFVAVWIALVILVTDMVVAMRRSRARPVGTREPEVTTAEIATQPAP